MDLRKTRHSASSRWSETLPKLECRAGLFSVAIYTRRLISHARLECLVNSLRLTPIVEIDTTNNDSGVRRGAMVIQAREVKTIVSD